MHDTRLLLDAGIGQAPPSATLARIPQPTAAAAAAVAAASGEFSPCVCVNPSDGMDVTFAKCDAPVCQVGLLNALNNLLDAATVESMLSMLFWCRSFIPKLSTALCMHLLLYVPLSFKGDGCNRNHIEPAPEL